MTEIDLTRDQCAALANYLRRTVDRGVDSGYDEIELMVLAQRALRTAAKVTDEHPVVRIPTKEELEQLCPRQLSEGGYVDRCARYADKIMALRGQYRWISVTERLPAEGERVLAAVEGAWVGEAYRDMRDVWMRSYGTPWDASIGVSVTHWMLLPDAPWGKELSCCDDT